MGKYMKKSKIIGDITVMEVSHQSTMGARTRVAKTLALRRLQKTTTSHLPAQVVSSTPDVSSFSYLQLRSRGLERLPSPVYYETKQKQQEKESSRREEKNNSEKKSEGCCKNNWEMVLGVGLCCETEEASCPPIRTLVASCTPLPGWLGLDGSRRKRMDLVHSTGAG